MKKIYDLFVAQIRIFPMDAIGFSSLKRLSSIAQIKNKYNFEVIPQIPEGLPIEANSIAFKNGEFQHQNKAYLVRNIRIEERRILITIGADSNVASELYSDLKELISHLDLRAQKNKYEPLILAQETTCIANLDFSMQDIFESSLGKNIGSLIESSIRDNDLPVLVYPSSIKFKIRYFISNLKITYFHSSIPSYVSLAELLST